MKILKTKKETSPLRLPILKGKLNKIEQPYIHHHSPETWDQFPNKSHKMRALARNPNYHECVHMKY